MKLMVTGLNSMKNLNKMIEDANMSEDILGRKIDEVNDKIDTRAGIKEECRRIDTEISDLAENSKPVLDKELRKLIDLLNHKHALNNDIKILDTDILEFKAISRELEGDDENLKMIKNREIVMDKKRYLLERLDDRHKNAEDGTQKLIKKINNTPDDLHSLEISLLQNKEGFDKEIQQLKFNLNELYNEEDFWKKDIQRLLIEADEIEQNAPQDQELLNSLSLDIKTKQEASGGNRERLKSAIIQNVHLNNKIFDKIKESKIIEGKIHCHSTEQYEAELKFLKDKLQYFVGKLKFERENVRINDINDLKITIDQKDRIILSLQHLIRELDSKILLAKTSAPTYTLKPHYRTHTHFCSDACYRYKDSKSIFNFTDFRQINEQS
jgi:chromosome segregation ATPase